ncbi:MAG TPA: DNA gyrase C-terminal beta-propeller domain-containing protein, partial [Terrimesophilobacter sp.]|nr:DNA gyrase C-terminal beta-propeller domain-containing protein [Terrimesophilobacter sp.]
GEPSRLRALVSHELDAVAEKYGTPRRTLLTEARPSVATTGEPRSRTSTAPDLEIADAPCRVLLSTTGRLVCVDLGDDTLGSPAKAIRRSKHDAIRSEVTTTTRGEVGAITNLGRLIRLSPVDLPHVPEASIQLAAGVKVAEYLALTAKSERVLALVPLDEDATIALGTAQGVVKRLGVSELPAKPDIDIIALKDGDEVVGATLSPDAEELVFVTSDAQLLRFDATSVRPQGRSAAGMAGIRVAKGARVVHFASVDAAATPVVVATISSASDTIAGADPGHAKLSYFSEFPAKGRATGGVRCHAFRKGESALSLAWVGSEPALAVGADGSVRELPDAGAKRDATGTPLNAVVGSIGTSPTG